MIDPKDLRLLKLSEIDTLPIPCVLYRKDGDTFRSVSITEEDMILFPTVIKATTKMYCEEKRMFIRINRPYRSFV